MRVHFAYSVSNLREFDCQTCAGFHYFWCNHFVEKVLTSLWTKWILCRESLQKVTTPSCCNCIPPPPSYGNFRHCDKFFRHKILILPPSYPNFSGTRNYCNGEGFPYGIFGHCETKKFRRKILVFPPSYPNFSGTRNYCNSKGFLRENFWDCERKISRRSI